MPGDISFDKNFPFQGGSIGIWFGKNFLFRERSIDKLQMYVNGNWPHES